MTKQIETITCVQCPTCGVKILETWHTEKKMSEIEIHECQQCSLDNHIKLHEDSIKYYRLREHVRQMAEITGDLENDA